MRSLPASRFVLLALAAAATPALAGAPAFQYTDLGTLGGPDARAFGINDDGHVVGWSNVSATIDCLTEGRPCRHAFLWDGVTMMNLGFLAGDEESVARGINNAGLVVGTSERDVIAGSGTFHGVQWTAGVIAALPDLGQGQSFVHDVNASGQIVGWTQDPSVSRDRAVMWDAGVITNLGDTEPHSYNRAIGVNDAGIVVGFAWNLFSPNDAVLYENGRGWTTIGGVDGPLQNAETRDVNDTGVAVGLMAFPSGAWHATMWSPAALDLGTLPGLEYSELNRVNDANQAVGRAYSDFVSHAIYVHEGQLYDLNDFLPAGFNGVLYEASDINANGDVVGTALVDGRFHAFVMTVALPCSGDITGPGGAADGNVDALDFLMLIGQWGSPCTGSCEADITGPGSAPDGSVDALDYLALIGQWGTPGNCPTP